MCTSQPCARCNAARSNGWPSVATYMNAAGTDEKKSKKPWWQQVKTAVDKATGVANTVNDAINPDLAEAREEKRQTESAMPWVIGGILVFITGLVALWAINRN